VRVCGFALIASLQYLTARQRAVLLLRGTCWGGPAAEVAALLGTTHGGGGEEHATAAPGPGSEPLARGGADQLSEPTETAGQRRLLWPVHRRLRECRRPLALEQLLHQGCHAGDDPIQDLVRRQRRPCARYIITQASWRSRGLAG